MSSKPAARESSSQLVPVLDTEPSVTPPTSGVRPSTDKAKSLSSPPSEPPVRVTGSKRVSMVPLARYGRFDLLGRIATGGMAEIFLARETAQTGATRELVVKRMMPHLADNTEYVDMFLGEARVAMRLSHPHICHVYEFGQHDGTWFIAMEWVNGAPLGKLIRKGKRELPVTVVAKIIAQVAEALHYAHDAKDEHGQPLGIVHRDVSPQNVMISFDGTVKLLDFGIAKLTMQPQKTQSGLLKGKFGYMSPEQCKGEPLTPRSDVFSLGICLYEGLTAKNLYRRGSEYETLKAIVEEPVPSARERNANVPEELDAIVQRALAKNPAERFESAGAMQDALEAFIAEQKQIVNAKRLAEVVVPLFREEYENGPEFESMDAAVVPVPELARGLGSTSDAAAKARVEGPTPTRSWTSTWVAVAVAVCVLAGGAWLANRLAQGGANERAQARATERAPAALPVASPSAQPSVAPSPVASAAPVALNDTSAPTNAGPTQEDGDLGGAFPTGTPATSGETPSARPSARPREEATLSLNTRPWSKVYVGSRSLGTTPIGGVRVPAGRLRLRLVDRDGVTHHHVLTLAPGQSLETFLDLTQANGSP